MVRWLGILLRTFRSAVRTRRELALENLALRQQLAVWKARQPRPRLTEMDRIFWIVLRYVMAVRRSGQILRRDAQRAALFETYLQGIPTGVWGGRAPHVS